MTASDLKNRLDKLAHDRRGPRHTAKLNLEAAEILAQKNGGPQPERLLAPIFQNFSVTTRR